MSIKVMSLVWEHSQHAGGDLLTMLAIADHADDAGMAFPSTDRLAYKTRMTRRNIINILKRLSDSGEIHIDRNAGPKGCNMYRINLSALDRSGENFSREKISHVKNFPVKTSDPKFHTNHKEPSGREEKETTPNGVVGAEVAQTTDFCPSPLRPEGAVPSARKKTNPLTPDDWLYQLLSTQSFIPDLPFAAVNNAEWWAKLSYLVESFDVEFMQYVLAGMGEYLERKPLKKPRSSVGWKTFFSNWFKKEGENQRRRAYAGTQAKEVHIHYGKR